MADTSLNLDLEDSNLFNNLMILTSDIMADGGKDVDVNKHFNKLLKNSNSIKSEVVSENTKSNHSDETMHSEESSGSESDASDYPVPKKKDRKDHARKDDSLFALIVKRFQLSKEIYDILLKNHFNVESLKVVQCAEINEAFPKPFLGIRALLLNKLVEWRKENGFTPYLRANSEERNRPKLETKISSPSYSNLSTEHSSPCSQKSSGSGFCLKDLLKATPAGKYFLNFHKKHPNEVFPVSKQNGLVRLIVEDFLFHKKRPMKRSEMKDVAKQIVDCFPSECHSFQETYYSSQYDEFGHKVKRNARGKLCEKNTNNTPKLAPEKIKYFEKVAYKPKEVYTEISVESGIDEAEADVHQVWLQANSEPIEEVKRRWKITTHIRQNSKHLGLTAEFFFKRWPALHRPNGWELIDIDFREMFPGKGDHLFTKWENFVDKIKIYYDINVKDMSSRLLLTELSSSSLDKDARDYTIFILLSTVLQSPRIKVGGVKKIWKPTILESREALVTQLADISDLECVVRCIKSKYHAMQLSLQPRIMVVLGRTPKVEQILVYYDEIYYNCETLLKAIDICFKIFHVINYNYPRESSLPWMFLQKYIYNITTEHDSKDIHVNNLIRYLRRNST